MRAETRERRQLSSSADLVSLALPWVEEVKGNFQVADRVAYCRVGSIVDIDKLFASRALYVTGMISVKSQSSESESSAFFRNTTTLKLAFRIHDRLLAYCTRCRHLAALQKSRLQVPRHRNRDAKSSKTLSARLRCAGHHSSARCEATMSLLPARQSLQACA